MSNEQESAYIDPLAPEALMNDSPLAEEKSEPIDSSDKEITSAGSEKDSPKESEDYDTSDSYGLSEETETKNASSDYDEYGNEKSSSKMYTEDEVNQRINEAVRKRFERFERNQPHNQAQQAAQAHAKQNFEYDANSSESWQTQLERFVENTVQNMHKRQIDQQRSNAEQRVMQEFEQKFTSGMQRFRDYADVVGSQPITDAMTMATRNMKDPAAFFYAASKFASDDLRRISQIPDMYAQMTEIGKLEERLKRRPKTTKAPKPVQKTRDDTSVNRNDDKELSIDDLIRRSDRKRLEQAKQRRG